MNKFIELEEENKRDIAISDKLGLEHYDERGVAYKTSFGCGECDGKNAFIRWLPFRTMERVRYEGVCQSCGAEFERTVLTGKVLNIKKRPERLVSGEIGLRITERKVSAAEQLANLWGES